MPVRLLCLVATRAVKYSRWDLLNPGDRTLYSFFECNQLLYTYRKCELMRAHIYSHRHAAVGTHAQEGV